MSGITAGVGLVSGINFTDTIDALMSIQRRPVTRLNTRSQGFQSRQTAIKTVEAGFLSLAATVTQLKTETNFRSYNTSVSDTSVRATGSSDATQGTYHFQAIQKSATHEILSKGLANADEQTFGTGTITIAQGGHLSQPTQLDVLNSGEGVRRGSIRITDRSGESANVDLSNAFTVEDVLKTINSNSTVGVTASVIDGALFFEDTTGSTTSDLIVADIGNGSTATDLGIEKTVSASSFTGDSIYTITNDFTLSQIDDANGPHITSGAADLRITLTDDTTLDITLDGAVNLGQVVSKINDDTNNAGRVTASLVSGRLQLTDNSGGGGSSALAVEDINSSSVVRSLGLDATASGTTLTGNRLIAGLNSTLLRNTRAGAGIDQLGQVSLTDRAGRTATIDLTAAESLDEVLHAINTATDGGGDALSLKAKLDARGTGLSIVDSSGATTSNLIIADVGGSTLATQLGIATDAATTLVSSGSLNTRYVSQSTQLDTYAPDGDGVQQGSFQITDSLGSSTTIDVTTSVKTIGDVIKRINSAAGVNVLASLNETGDGFVITDQAGGAGTLSIADVGATTTAADLRIVGEATDGKIQSRLTTVVDVEATDTLNDIVTKLNAAGSTASAAVLNDGSAFNSTRLSLLATESGSRGRLIVDDGGLGFSLTTRIEGQDALLRTGQNVETGFLIASSNDSFNNVVAGIDIDVLQPSTEISQVSVDRNDQKISGVIRSFVNTFNSIVDTVSQATSFDLEGSTRGVLQGDGFVLRVVSRLDSVIHKQFSDSGSSIRSLAQIGVTVGTGGKLRINDKILNAAIDDNADAVAEFFLKDETGFASVLEDTLEGLTDPFDGSFAVENESLQRSIDNIGTRIGELEAILSVRRDRMLLEFVRMEEAISALNSQQQSLSSLSVIRLPSSSN